MIRRPSVNRDLAEIYRYYARQAGMRVADRFFDQAEATFARLARRLGLGTRYEELDLEYVERAAALSGWALVRYDLEILRRTFALIARGEGLSY